MLLYIAYDGLSTCVGNFDKLSEFLNL